MKTARNCALVLTVFACTSGMRFVSDEQFSNQVGVNLTHLLGPSLAATLLGTVPGDAANPWLNVSLGRDARDNPALARLDRMLEQAPAGVSPGFGQHLVGTTYGVNTHLPLTPGG